MIKRLAQRLPELCARLGYGFCSIPYLRQTTSPSTLERWGFAGQAPQFSVECCHTPGRCGGQDGEEDELAVAPVPRCNPFHAGDALNSHSGSGASTIVMTASGSKAT
jgi:hypothetical protein